MGVCRWNRHPPPRTWMRPKKKKTRKKKTALVPKRLSRLPLRTHASAHTRVHARPPRTPDPEPDASQPEDEEFSEYDLVASLMERGNRLQAQQADEVPAARSLRVSDLATLRLATANQNNPEGFAADIGAAIKATTEEPHPGPGSDGDSEGYASMCSDGALVTLCQQPAESTPPRPRKRSPRDRGSADGLLSKASVFGMVRQAIEDRAGCGLNDDLNREITRRHAEQTCQAHRLTGDNRKDYLGWVDDALAHVLDGEPIPSFYGSPVRDIVRLPAGVAV
jgi:hypothetical protein